MFVSGFFEPLFYLLSIGVGIGGLVGTVVPDAGAALSYQRSSRRRCWPRRR